MPSARNDGTANPAGHISGQPAAALSPANQRPQWRCLPKAATLPGSAVGPRHARRPPSRPHRHGWQLKARGTRGTNRRVGAKGRMRRIIRAMPLHAMQAGLSASQPRNNVSPSPKTRKFLAWKMSLTASRSTHSAGAGGRYAPCWGHQSAEARLPSEGALAAHLAHTQGSGSRGRHQATRRQARRSAVLLPAVVAARGSFGSRTLKGYPRLAASLRSLTCSTPPASAACRRSCCRPAAAPAPPRRRPGGCAAPAAPPQTAAAGSAAACRLQQPWAVRKQQQQDTGFTYL